MSTPGFDEALARIQGLEFHCEGSRIRPRGRTGAHQSLGCH